MLFPFAFPRDMPAREIGRTMPFARESRVRGHELTRNGATIFAYS